MRNRIFPCCGLRSDKQGVEYLVCLVYYTVLDELLRQTSAQPQESKTGIDSKWDRMLDVVLGVC